MVGKTRPHVRTRVITTAGANVTRSVHVIRVGVIGAGAIGCYVGGRLSR